MPNISKSFIGAFIIVFSCLSMKASSQNFYTNIDSLRAIVQSAAPDSARLKSLNALALHYSFVNADSGVMFGNEAVVLAEKTGKPLYQADAFLAKSWALWSFGNLDLAARHAREALNIYKATGVYDYVISSLAILSNIYRDAGDTRLGITFGKEALALYDSLGCNDNAVNGTATRSIVLNILAASYMVNGSNDSAYMFLSGADQDYLNGRSFPMVSRGYIEIGRENYDSAIVYFKRSIPVAIKTGFIRDILDSYGGLSEAFLQKGLPDSAIYYARAAVYGNVSSYYKFGIYSNLNLMAQAFQVKGNNDSAIVYLNKAMAAYMELYNLKSIRAMQELANMDELQKIQLEAERKVYRGRMQFFTALALLLGALIGGLLLYRNNRQKQKAFGLLEVEKKKVDSALADLKSTQAQLVQSEKMASLGELTAGIAHEIQNPLNFVNNFSDLNRELIGELQEELRKGDIRQAASIAENLKDNEEKINLHGRRADGIVKSMLQHSRTSSGQKEPIDVNKLMDEYVRLAYHGFRARQKDFNTALDFDLDPLAGQVKMVSQDIGRVLLNLLNNAFQAVQEKARTASGDYQPRVTVSTKRNEQGVEIRVADNGPGIPDSIRDKIFQPFFTTKPTGQGTGLGLSLSYDIVKAHGGTIQMETYEGSGTRFIVQLPV